MVLIDVDMLKTQGKGLSPDHRSEEDPEIVQSSSSDKRSVLMNKNNRRGANTRITNESWSIKTVRDYSSVVVQGISTVLGHSIEEIKQAADTTTFIELGGDSLSAILICAECQHRGLSIQAGVFLRMLKVREMIEQAVASAQLIPTPSPMTSTRMNLRVYQTSFLPDTGYGHKFASGDHSCDGIPSIHTTVKTPDLEVADASVHHDGVDIISAKTLLDRIDLAEWTEPQLFLLRETSHNSMLNMLTLCETYTDRWEAADIYNAWMNTIVGEPIFRDLVYSLEVSPHQLMLPKLVQVNKEEEYRQEVHNAVKAHGAISRLTLIQVSNTLKQLKLQNTVVWRVHHAFLDGYSAMIIRDKISHHLRRTESSTLAGPSFRKTVQSLRALQLEKREATRNFWRTKREAFPRALGNLRLNPQRAPLEAPVPPQRCLTIEFAEEHLAAARTRTGYTTTVYLAAAWALTLSRFLDTDQICFGMVFSGRDLPVPGTFDVVGPLLNILPLFVSVPDENDEHTSVRDFLRRIHDDMLELNGFQHSETTDGFHRQFDSIMASQFECDKPQEEPSRPLPIDPNRPDMRSGVPMNLIIEQQCRLRVFYSTTQYTVEDMNNVGGVLRKSMEALLQGSGGDSRLMLAKNAKLLPVEMEKRLRLWSNCQSFETLDESKENDLVTLFESVVMRQPWEIAIIHGRDERMSYDTFDQAAAAVAHKLSWIKHNEPVCVNADRSVNWLIAIFGILKAGGVYTPLDPSAPVSIRHANFARSGARIVLVPSSKASTHAPNSKKQEMNGYESFGCLVLVIEELLPRAITGKKRTLSLEYPRRLMARPDDLAYICFTSGSTGQPKAVKCTHKGVVAFQKDQTVRLAAMRDVVIAQIMSPVFDGSIHEIFSALTYGATLRLPSPDNQDHPFSHLEDADSAILTPSIAKALDPKQYPRLQNVYLVGEAVPQLVADTWAVNRSLYNMYGPTEATCGATIKQLLPNRPVNLGKANPSSRVYVLDRHKNLLPPGAVGEIYLAGIQVSQGYIGLADLNAQRFLDDSIMPETGQKMYKTGDYAYWDAENGDLCIIGRKDRQIKLCGFRLDLDDLEARVVKAIPGCGGAAIFRQENHLVAAYQTPNITANGLKKNKIRSLVCEALPTYAMPRRVVALKEFPLTVAGKLDYKAIEAMVRADEADVYIEAQVQKRPMSETEIMLVEAIRDLMKLDASMHLDQESNMTALGGHSILQIQLASRISSLTGRRFTVRAVIDNPLILDLAAAIDEVLGQAAEDNHNCLGQQSSAEDRGSVLGESQISPIELDWYRKYQLNLGTTSFNVSHVSRFDEGFDQHQKLMAAWNTVLGKHAILRCRYQRSIKDDSVKRSYAAEPPRASFVESLDIRGAINREFSLKTEDPIRVLISRHYMLVCASHIICDYTTLNQLFLEVTSAYTDNDFTEGTSLRPPRKRYQDTTCWNSEIDRSTAGFWQSYLRGVDNLNAKPYMKTSRTSYHGESLLFKLSADATSGIQTVSRALGLTFHQIALAAVSVVLQAANTIKKDLVLGSPHLGRQGDDMKTIGLFLQPLPIRIRRQSEQEASVASFLLGVQESAQLALGHGVEWNSLMQILSTSDDQTLRAATAVESPNHPLFEAMVTFHEASITGQAPSFPLSTAIPGIQQLVSWADGAKFGIMFEFSALNSSMTTLRIEYDTSIFSSKDVRKFATCTNACLKSLSEDITATRLAELETRILDVDTDEPLNRSPLETLEELEFGSIL